MSDKRFELDRTGIFDNKTNHFYYKTFDNEEVVDLLNKLSKENEQLKSTVTHLQEECGARENDYVNLKKQLDKIPPRIKEIWLNG